MGVDVADVASLTGVGAGLEPVERVLLAMCPEVQACVAVPGGDGRSRLDVLVTLSAGAGPHATAEQAILAALPTAVAERIGHVRVVTDEWLVRGPASSIDRPATRRRFQDFQRGLWLPGLGSGCRPEPRPGERIRVPFSGPGSGRGALTWGQRDIWATMIRQQNWLPQGGRRPLAPGTRPEDLADELAYLHGRYPTMRTRFAVDPLVGQAQQWLVSSGETFLEVYDTAANQDPDVLAANVEATYRRRPYDLRSEWPIRMAVIRSGGVCTHLVAIMHHLALDAGGAAVMFREVAGREDREPGGMQPLEQAAWQASEAGRRHNDKTLRHFAQALGTEAASGSTPHSEPPSSPAVSHHPRHWSGRLTSPGLAASVAAISERTGVDDSSVLTASIGVAFARLTNRPRVVLRPRVGNRFRPPLSDVVCFVAQSGLLVLDLADTTFDEATARARRATMAAMKNAYFDPDTLEPLLARSDHGIAMFFNDRRSARPPVAYTTEAAPAPREPRTVRGTSVFTWLHRGPEPTEPLAVTLDDAGGSLSLALHFDTQVITPDLVEKLAWGVEQAAAEAERNGDAATGL